MSTWRVTLPDAVDAVEALEPLAPLAQIERLDGSPQGRVLVLGGARSGKSSWAEKALWDLPAVDYLATAPRYPDDAEWQQRIALHRERRPDGWRTIESMDVAGVLAEQSDVPVLVDCLTVWLTRAMDETGVWEEQPGCDEALADATSTLVQAFARCRRPVIAVSNEVGQGVVPASSSGRRFRDEMGRLNIAVAAVVDQVWFCTAGIAQRLR